MKRPHPPERIEVGAAELGEILARATSSPLSADDVAKLAAAIDTLALLTRELEAKGTTIDRLRRLLFGAPTETTSRVLGERRSGGGRERGEKKKRRGHGRNGAAAYRGAEHVPIPHASLSTGDECPSCHDGKVYPQSEPKKLVRVKGMAPLQATVYECARFRCHTCGEVFTAAPPPGIGTEKYDDTAAAMIGLLKYGTGLPFNRLEKLQGSLGIPLPAATQWDVAKEAAERLTPAHAELARQAAQGEVLHNDDTGGKILELTAEARAEELPDGSSEERTGCFTSAIVSRLENRHRIALYVTGPRHAGENLAALLSQRERDRPPPIQMSDALSRNCPTGHETIKANCLSHSRRNYVEVVENFPEECRVVLEALREVYRNDAIARERELSDEERLRFHQAESEPVMTGLRTWIEERLERREVEPSSGLGQAIRYMLDHWDKLTLFLRVPGAPLDNNIAERALKKAILHRKNSLFYKTLNGARVGDLFMSLIHTAELAGADPFDYLVALLRHEAAVLLEPALWMPWNYKETLARMAAAAAPTELTPAE